MARGKKTGGRNFRAGKSGNPNGRPKVPEDLKKSRAINKINFEEVLNRYAFMTAPDINTSLQSKELPIIEMVVAKILAKAFNEGDPRRADFILDRLIGKASDKPLPPPPPTLTEPTLTFKQFCQRAGYFEPFAKQEIMRAFALDETAVRLLLGARGYGKTDFCTIMGTAYDLYVAWKNNSDMSEHTNLIITKSDKRCKAIVAEISHALRANGVPLDKDTTSELRVAGLIGQDHSVEAITIKTSMRGRHPKRIIMDDPVTDEDTSEAMRTTVKKRYDEAYKLCSNIVIIGQPAHFDDLYANLRGVIKTMEMPYGSIPELDADLDAMLAAQIDRNSIEMSYHLRVPKDGSSIFSNLKFIDAFPSGASVAFIDPSDGGDYTAVSAIRGHMDAVAVEGKAWKKAWYHCIDEMVEFFVKVGVKRVAFETNKHGNQPIGQLQELLAPFGIGVVGVFSSTDKHAVIESAGSYAHMIYLSKNSDKVYTEQVTKYEYNSKYDDAPDSLARGLVWLGLLKAKK